MQPPTGNERPPAYSVRPSAHISSTPQAPPFATTNVPVPAPGFQSRPPFLSSPAAPGATATMHPQAPFGSGQPVQQSSAFGPVGPTYGIGATTSPPVRFNGPSSVGPTSTPTYQQPEVPRFPTPSQPVNPLQSSYMRFPPQPPLQSVPMGSPPTQIGNQFVMRSNVPPPPPSTSTSALAQQQVHGFTNVNQQQPMYQPPPPPLPGQRQFPSVGSAAGPHGQMQFPRSGPTMVSPPQMQFPSVGPPVGPSVGSTGAIQSLLEEFQSLSVGAVPGSIDSGIDPKSLPRPLQGDEELTRILESYPLNCHPRYFRLTTHALPNSQSLHARWHLPLGAVVHPLAESPDGVLPVVHIYQ
jgi:protein transport protein SEC24